MSLRFEPVRWVWFALAVLLLTAVAGRWSQVRAQQPYSEGASSMERELLSQMGMAPAHHRQSAMQPAVEQRQILLLEQARYKSMVADADRLQVLASQLAAERAQKPGPYTPAQQRMLFEIEKLARRIKETMRAEGPAKTADTEFGAYPASMR